MEQVYTMGGYNYFYNETTDFFSGHYELYGTHRCMIQNFRTVVRNLNKDISNLKYQQTNHFFIRLN